MSCISIVAVIVLAYANSLKVPFLLDDGATIEGNESIRSLAEIGKVLSPPVATTVEGRPVANLSLAINYAISGISVWSYHVVNVLIHVGATLLLFGVFRRTLAKDSRFSASAELVAWVAAALWALHPLQTESVTYVVQRVESLMGFFYLLTFYAFIRSAEQGARVAGWRVLAIAACWLGMGTKEVMVSAPLVVLLYDRTFIANSFGDALRRRWRFYAALFASWLLLAWLLSSSIDRNNTTGFGAGVSWWHYLLTQCRAIVIYLRLSVWPDNLVFDYGRLLVKDPWTVFPQALFLISLALLTVWLVIRRSALGVVGAWFFATLAPSSSIVPVVTQTMTEHRMYLALAAVMVLLVAAAHRLAGVKAVIGLGVCVPVLGWATYQRNELYQDPIKLWEDTVRKVPGSTRARNNLGSQLNHQGKLSEALVHFEAAMDSGDYVDAHVCTNYAFVLYGLGRLDDAEAQLKRALVFTPTYHKALALLGTVEMKRGRIPAAVPFLEEALRRNAKDVASWVNLGRSYVHLGHPEKGRLAYREAVAIDSSNSHAWTGLGDIAYAAQQWEEAASCFQRAAENATGSDAALARSGLGDVRAMQKRLPEAEAEYIRALELDPQLAIARKNWAMILARTGRFTEAAAEFERTRIQLPNDAEVIGSLGMVHELTGRWQQAVECYNRALQLDPNHPFAQVRLDALRKGGHRMP
jgi:protein O-mannosyl-transferase